MNGETLGIAHGEVPEGHMMTTVWYLVIGLIIVWIIITPIINPMTGYPTVTNLSRIPVVEG